MYLHIKTKLLFFFNPLEQFEINTPIFYFSKFFNYIETSSKNTNFDFVYYKENSYLYNLSYNSENFISFFNIRKYLVQFDSLSFTQIDNFDFFDKKVELYNLFPTSDFFYIYQFLILLIFFLFYQNFFFFSFIKYPLKFIIFVIINFIMNTIKNMHTNLIKYSPYLITLFFFILFLNILGLIPFVKSLTSTISITFFLSLSSFLGLNIEGLSIHKLHFFDKFAPASVPFIILPGLVIIELISYFMRPNSLAIRLFANMLAGHILIKLFITFCVDLSSVSLILFIGCFLFICILMTLEVFISFLQAYIFMFLVLLYLDDVINATH